MVGPMLAENGHSFERREFEELLATNSTRPLHVSCSIEELSEPGELDDKLYSTAQAPVFARMRV